MNPPDDTPAMIDPHAAQEILRERRAMLLDVRTPAEYAAEHVAGSRNLPVERCDGPTVASFMSETGATQTLILCRGGGRAKMVYEKLRQQGQTNIQMIAGGLDAWRAARLPVVTGTRSVISLERQVRIVVGALVLLASLLGALVHPGWSYLAALFGAGLLFAGITDFCGLALLLGRMPWNRA